MESDPTEGGAVLWLVLFEGELVSVRCSLAETKGLSMSSSEGTFPASRAMTGAIDGTKSCGFGSSDVKKKGRCSVAKDGGV